ncbi:threonine synthase, partial [Ochromonadaceae sp. CCMP2298]
ALVKAAFADPVFRDEVKLGAINSINWARVLAQITYYFYSYLRVTDGGEPGTPVPVSYAVPTGNFGDILAGYFAKRMGLNVGKLVICTNENDVLRRFLQTGVYDKKPALLTVAPSMDISVSSNFERYLYFLAGEDGATLHAWMETFEATGQLTVPPSALRQARSDFSSFTADKALIVHTMAQVYKSENYLLCPHTGFHHICLYVTSACVRYI